LPIRISINGEEAFDYALTDLEASLPGANRWKHHFPIFSDHLLSKLKAGARAGLWLVFAEAARAHRGGAATGGLCFSTGVGSVASGRYEVAAGDGIRDDEAM